MIDEIPNLRMINVFAPSRSGHNFVMNMIRDWFIPGQVHVANHENKHPSELATRINNRGETSVLVVRDLKNWIASMLRWTLNRNEAGRNNWTVMQGIRPRHAAAWLEVAREAKGTTHYLHQKIVIDYLKFKNDEDYRRNICKKLDGDYSEDMLNTVSTAGGGSSFGELPLDTGDRYLWWEKHENKGYRKVYARELKFFEEANTPIELY